jgi:hypothetical protein
MGRRRTRFHRKTAIAASLVFLAAIAVSLHLVLPRSSGVKNRRHGPATTLTTPPATPSVSAPVRDQPPPGSTDCAGAPGSGRPNYSSLDHCGYPSPRTSGVPAGTHLTPSSSINANRPGEIITGRAVSGTIDVAANDVTIEDTKVTTSGDFGIVIESGVIGTVINNVTLDGLGTTASSEMQWGIYNEGDFDALSADRVDFYNGERILSGPGTLTNSFCLDNVDNRQAHYECVYEGGGSVAIEHNTLLTAHPQTAAIYLSTDSDSLGAVKVTDNLLAGGGYALYGGANSDGSGVSSETVTGNRFSRLYYPDGGYYGPTAYMPDGYAWSGNVWDDTGLPVSP